MSQNLNSDPNSRRRVVEGADANFGTVNPTVDEVTFPATTGARTLFLPNPAADTRVQNGWQLKVILADGPTAGNTLTVSCPAVGAIGAKNINGAATKVLGTDYQSAIFTWNKTKGQYQCSAA